MFLEQAIFRTNLTRKKMTKFMACCCPRNEVVASCFRFRRSVAVVIDLQGPFILADYEEKYKRNKRTFFHQGSEEGVCR